MTDREKVQQIVDKYGDSYSQLSQNATNKELKTFMKFLADEANKKQSKLFEIDGHSTAK
ncbi:MAG: hypothetical protein GX453_04730 [Lactococcus chungangensis]|jgi:phage-related protein|uniref:Uncharacterized protein n=1 Tax=Pseudolactococcus chungangensis TaxID=451457 RepID=A0A847J327_9LACT|nr:hypothetical protein [Lactococcus chungangensis]